MSRRYDRSQSYGSQPSKLESWKASAARTWAIRYPSPLPEVRYPAYEPVVGPREVLESRTDVAHLDDYPQFVEGIVPGGIADLRTRLQHRAAFGSSRPSTEHFPECPQDVARPVAPPPPTWLEKFVGSNIDTKRREIEEVRQFNEWADRELPVQIEKWQKQRLLHIATSELRLRQWEAARTCWEEAHAVDAASLDRILSGYSARRVEQVTAYFELHLQYIETPDWCPRDWRLFFDDGQGMLLLRIRLPFMPGLEVRKTRELRTETKEVPATKTESTRLRKDFSFMFPLRFLWEIAQSDSEQVLKGVACNAYAVYDDPATGRTREDTVMSLVCDPERLRSIELARVEPEVCFRALRGISAADILGLIPVQPILDFDKNDKRFVESRPVLGGIEGTNLATMDWQDFEHLVRELFERLFGTDVRITQASRDRGVDAVAFDPDPIRGGKFVIQAKRYVNTVDVSAVRDLYGTMLNEGANRGILVTTSNYGRDAYEFISGKPISLINGEHLLHLLASHGFQCRIDLTGTTGDAPR